MTRTFRDMRRETEIVGCIGSMCIGGGLGYSFGLSGVVIAIGIVSLVYYTIRMVKDV